MELKKIDRFLSAMFREHGEKGQNKIALLFFNMKEEEY